MVTRRKPKLTVPSMHDWRTTDVDEVNRRKLRAQNETFRITNLDPRHPIFSNFRVLSPSGMSYSVELRHLGRRELDCTCIDFSINGLGTCKHVEALLLHLEARHPR